MASKTLTELVTELRVENAASAVKVQSLPDQADAYADLADRLARAEIRIEELTKARDLASNRLFQIGVAILAAQFALIGTLLGLILRK